MSKSIVVADTDILVHMMNGGIFNLLVPDVIQEIYIPPRIEVELKRRNLHTHLFSQVMNSGGWVKTTKERWAQLPDEKKQKVSAMIDEYQAELDPGELQCYAYSVELGIDGILSDDGGAREFITEESNKKKIVLNFAQLLLLGVKLDKLSISKARQYFDQVIRANQLYKFAPFERQIEVFDSYTVNHPWVQQFLP